MQCLQLLADALAGLDDDKFEYVMNKCLSVVRGTRNDKDWVPVWNSSVKFVYPSDESQRHWRSCQAGTSFGSTGDRIALEIL